MFYSVDFVIIGVFFGVFFFMFFFWDMSDFL